jgi:DNA-binding HxlR family transcriptional regulator
MANFNADVQCPMTATLQYIGGRWKCVILYYLTAGTRRFGEIAVRMPISRKVLTQQLKELERDGLIVRKQYNEIPPRVEYTLTELGMSLTPVFKAISTWGKTHVLK